MTDLDGDGDRVEGQAASRSTFQLLQGQRQELCQSLGLGGEIFMGVLTLALGFERGIGIS